MSNYDWSWCNIRGQKPVWVNDSIRRRKIEIRSMDEKKDSSIIRKITSPYRLVVNDRKFPLVNFVLNDELQKYNREISNFSNEDLTLFELILRFCDISTFSSYQEYVNKALVLFDTYKNKFGRNRGVIEIPKLRRETTESYDFFVESKKTKKNIKILEKIHDYLSKI